MKNKTKKQQISPWQTIEQSTFTQKIPTGYFNQKVKTEQKIKQSNVNGVEINKPQILQNSQKKVKSSIRLKTQKLIEQNQKPSVPLKRLVSEQKPPKISNKNFISILNKYCNQKLNPQLNHKKIELDQKFHQKNESKSLQKSTTLKTKLSLKIQINKIKQKKKLLQIKNIKKTIYLNGNSSIQTLVKAKKQLEKIQTVQQIPILRKQSVKTMKLDTEQHQKQFKRQKQKSNMKKNLSQSRTKFFSVDNKLSTTQTFPKFKNQIINRSIVKTSQSKSKNHVLDRLFDKLC